eukprot:TRINITY_DN32_c1_g1_i4.p1 TRINITY_DN32_c1_g1~~TRINITY_DN32_c1_g1_i4.p1  ORF type:complete len:428 (+),score=-19.33 TRINITY_DN32_c1_g1_i4:348-1631(+)
MKVSGQRPSSAAPSVQPYMRVASHTAISPNIRRNWLGVLVRNKDCGCFLNIQLGQSYVQKLNLHSVSNLFVSETGWSASPTTPDFFSFAGFALRNSFRRSNGYFCAASGLDRFVFLDTQVHSFITEYQCTLELKFDSFRRNTLQDPSYTIRALGLRPWQLQWPALLLAYSDKFYSEPIPVLFIFSDLQQSNQHRNTFIFQCLSLLSSLRGVSMAHSRSQRRNTHQEYVPPGRQCMIQQSQLSPSPQAFKSHGGFSCYSLTLCSCGSASKVGTLALNIQCLRKYLGLTLMGCLACRRRTRHHCWSNSPETTRKYIPFATFFNMLCCPHAFTYRNRNHYKAGCVAGSVCLGQSRGSLTSVECNINEIMGKSHQMFIKGLGFHKVSSLLKKESLLLKTVNSQPFRLINFINIYGYIELSYQAGTPMDKAD